MPDQFTSFEPIEGDLLQDLVPTVGENKVYTLSAEQLEELVRRVAETAYQEAEKVRQSFQRTPDGLLDKTLSNYKPATPVSEPLLTVEGSGTEKWHLLEEYADKAIHTDSERHAEAIAFRLLSTHPGMTPQLVSRLTGVEIGKLLTDGSDGDSSDKGTSSEDSC